jgi:hypothetical protein
MPGGKKSRDKGVRSERNLVRKLRELGIPARRVPLSGSHPGEPDDLIICDCDVGEKLDSGHAGHAADASQCDVTKRAEVKVRAKGFKQIYRWIEGTQLLFIKNDGGDWLVVQRLSDASGLRSE